jgi:hypothetical protein
LYDHLVGASPLAQIFIECAREVAKPLAKVSV